MIIFPNHIELMASGQCVRNLEADETLVNAIEYGSELSGAKDPFFEKVDEPLVLGREDVKLAINALRYAAGFEAFALDEPKTKRAQTALHYLGTFEAFVAFDASEASPTSLAA